MFRKGRPLSRWLHFGLHFGVILGAKFATILLLGRPGGQNRLTKERLNKINIKQKNENRPYGELQVTGPGALETVKLSDNQTVQLSLQHWAPETLHFVPRTSGMVADIYIYIYTRIYALLNRLFVFSVCVYVYYFICIYVCIYIYIYSASLG